MATLTLKWVKNSKGKLAIYFLCIVLLAACMPLTPTSATPANPGGDTQAAGAENPESSDMIEYHRQGGFAGFDDQLTIASDGQATLVRRGKSKSATIDPALIQQLQQALDTANFASLNAEYVPAEIGEDYMEHTITYQGHAVHAVDTATPDALLPILSILTDVITQVQ